MIYTPGVDQTSVETFAIQHIMDQDKLLCCFYETKTTKHKKLLVVLIN